MIGRNINLYDLNLLAQRLTALTPEENTGMEALLAMEWSRRRGSVSLEHLINLTYNTDVCCLAPQVSNLQELGAFLYENEMLSKEAMALLDTTEEDSEFRASLLKLLGEQHKEDHGGVFTKRGYAVPGVIPSLFLNTLINVELLKNPEVIAILSSVSSVVSSIFLAWSIRSL